MTAEELEAYKENIIKEIQSIDKVKILYTIKNIIDKSKDEQKHKIIHKIALESDHCCCYTAEEIRNNVIEALEQYKEEKYIAEDYIHKPVIKWSLNAYHDLKIIRMHYESSYIYKIAKNIDKALGIIAYNAKAGKRDDILSDLFDGNIRSIIVEKNSKIIYVEMPDSIFILAIQQII